MALPVVLAIFQAGMAAVGFKACEQAASEDDVRLAMEAVAMLGSSTGNWFVCAAPLARFTSCGLVRQFGLEVKK